MKGGRERDEEKREMISDQCRNVALLAMCKKLICCLSTLFGFVVVIVAIPI